MMPKDVRFDIELFARGGLGILTKIEEAGYDVWRERPKLRKWDKLALIGGVWMRQFWSRPARQEKAGSLA
jgi:hypothetical protein